MMEFKVKGLEFHKVTGINGNVKGVSVYDAIEEKIIAFITDDDWISVITEMSHKPENAEQHKKAKEFHLGEK
jgi:hypothetical protein